MAASIAKVVSRNLLNICRNKVVSRRHLETLPQLVLLQQQLINQRVPHVLTWSPQHHYTTDVTTETVTHQDRVTAVEDDAVDDVLYRAIEIEAKGHDLAVLNSYEKFCCLAAGELGLNMANVWTPPRVIERRTLLKSKHIFKKHRVQYEQRTNFRVFQLKHLTGSSADTYLEYVERNLPEGIALKVTRHRLERIPDHLIPPEDTSEASTLPYPPYNQQS